MLHHGKRLMLVACFLASTAAIAQVGPEIAYATGGARAEIHLINADSSSHRLLYRGQQRTEIFHVDIKPGGGELAIEEHILQARKPGSPEPVSAIKIINYDASGSIVGSVRTLQLSCLTGSLDYHPTDGTLLFRNCSNPNRISRLNTTTMNISDLGLSHDAFVASWLDATHLLYYADAKFWTVSTGALTSPTEVVAWPSPGSLDTSTSGNRALLSGFGAIRLIDIAAGQISLFQVGNKGHFSPDDVNVVYITGDGGGKSVLIRRTDGAGAPTNVTGRGNYTAVDWQN